MNAKSRLFEDNVKDIARLIVWENGKSWNDAFAEATYAASFISWFQGEAVRQYGEIVPCSLPGTRNFTIKQPIGVCALLVPWVATGITASTLMIRWNFPAAMIARKIAPVLATGCTAVIKVPSETPFTNLAIVEVMSDTKYSQTDRSFATGPESPLECSMSSPARPTCKRSARS